MIDFSSWLDLPLIWGGLIAVAVLLYVILDGFDLGCGILFPFAPSDSCRDRIMNSIAPFWDGNETWLVLGGGGLFVAFPVAYAILMPAFYLPVILMLVGLIFRGVAFEFRFKTDASHRYIWDTAFHGGSLLASFMQGVMLGNFLQGVKVVGRHFAGGSLDWANGFAFFMGFVVVCLYVLLGATWLIMKTEGQTQAWARKAGRYIVAFMSFTLPIFLLTMPFMDNYVAQVWLEGKRMLLLSPIPLGILASMSFLWYDLFKGNHETRPFLLTLGLFVCVYAGIIASIYPWIVPFKFKLWDAAAVPTSLSLVLVGTVVLLPIILFYVGYCYYVFRGKSSASPLY